MTGRRAGFTILELMMVMVVIGVLAGLAILKYVDLRHRARAVQAAADLESVRLAAYGAWYENGTWPPEVSAGIVPPGLAPYLAKNFTFARPEYTLDWENFVPPGGGSSAGMQLGVVVTSPDARLQKALMQTLGNKLPFINVGGTLTFVIVGPDGKS